MADKISGKHTIEEESATSRLVTKVVNKADKLKYIVLAVVVLFVVVAVLFTYFRRQTARREALAENALYQAELDLAVNPAAGADIFGKLAKDYAGLPAGAKAQIVRFSHAYNTRNFQEAEAAAKEFLGAYPKSILVSRARLALGQAQLMNGKTADAVATFRQLVSARSPEVLPEAKLALAQALERQADEAKDQPEEYRRRLEMAAEEYADIVGQAQSPVQRGFWPQAVVLPADFALVAIRDRLTGYQHQAPMGRQASAAAAVPSTIDMTQIPPPPADPAAEAPSASEAAEVEAATRE